MRSLLPGISTFLLLAFAGCGNNKKTTDPTPDPVKVNGSATIQIDRSQHYQTIDGFGFFGAQKVWWESDRSKLYSDAWARQVINGLGITPTATSKLKELCEVMRTDYTIPSGKPIWMTETSGYLDDWKRTDGKTGALDLAMDIQSALYYGKASAWVWWQGSGGDKMDEYSLKAGTFISVLGEA